MNAREAILGKLKAAAVPARLGCPPYRPDIGNDLEAQFLAKAEAAHVGVHLIPTMAELAGQLGHILAENGFSSLHLPPDSPLRALSLAGPNLVLETTPPSGDESSLSSADFAIAETGTLAFLSGAGTPSSWHFLAGSEFVVVRKTAVVGTLEEVLAHLKRMGMPATLNLVTGPSRTADIEQTIVRGAHGPRALHVLYVAE